VADPTTELAGLAGRPTISLDEVLASAPATTRVDRKYLVRRSVAEALVEGVPQGLRVLAIDGRLATSYRSTYFDTADLMTCRAHVQRRRRRWKARSRLYVEDGLCRLELKVRDGSGLTRKYFHPTGAADHGKMNTTTDAFFRGLLLELGLPPAAALEASVDIGYRRATLADPDSGVRVTIDFGVSGTRHGHSVRVDPDCLIIETKGAQIPGVADRLLSRLGARPVSFSKYAATASLLDPRIPDNDVRHLVGRDLHVTTTTRLEGDDLRRTA
jgi:hypothetical protein